MTPVRKLSDRRIATRLRFPMYVMGKCSLDSHVGIVATAASRIYRRTAPTLRRKATNASTPSPSTPLFEPPRTTSTDAPAARAHPSGEAHVAAQSKSPERRPP
jgi:hypothetical protein